MKNYILLFTLTASLPLMSAASIPEINQNTDAEGAALKLMALKKCPAPTLTDAQIKDKIKLARLSQKMHAKRRQIPLARTKINPNVVRKLF